MGSIWPQYTFEKNITGIQSVLILANVKMCLRIQILWLYVHLDRHLMKCSQQNSLKLIIYRLTLRSMVAPTEPNTWLHQQLQNNISLLCFTCIRCLLTMCHQFVDDCKLFPTILNVHGGCQKYGLPCDFLLLFTNPFKEQDMNTRSSTNTKY